MVADVFSVDILNRLNVMWMDTCSKKSKGANVTAVKLRNEMSNIFACFKKNSKRRGGGGLWIGLDF